LTSGMRRWVLLLAILAMTNVCSYEAGFNSAPPAPSPATATK